MRLKPETTGFVRGGALYLEPPAKWRSWQRDVWRCCGAGARPATDSIDAAAFTAYQPQVTPPAVATGKYRQVGKTMQVLINLDGSITGPRVITLPENDGTK